MTRITVREITGLDTLAGRSGGLRDFSKFVAAIEETPEGETVVLDWAGVEIATASYFASTLAVLLRMAMAGELDRYFIAVGLNKTCREELKLVLELQALAVLVGRCDREGSIQNVEVLGVLDPAYAETLETVQRVEGASAAGLHKQQTRTLKGIGRTGWINRLSNLYRLRLLKRQRVGRQYVFQAVFKEK